MIDITPEQIINQKSVKCEDCKYFESKYNNCKNNEVRVAMLGVIQPLIDIIFKTKTPMLAKYYNNKGLCEYHKKRFKLFGRM